MSTTDRCACYQELIKHVGDGFAKFQIAETDNACHVHGDIDEIIASGRYTDRQDREWQHAWFGWWTPRGGVELPPAQMRLLIERDQHRGECPGLHNCHDHPVPVVYPLHRYPQGGFASMGRDNYIGKWFSNLPEAMSAARALVVGE